MGLCSWKSARELEMNFILGSCDRIPGPREDGGVPFAVEALHCASGLEREMV